MCKRIHVFQIGGCTAALEPFLLRNSTSVVVLSMTMALPSISPDRSQHFVRLSCPQTVQGPFSSEETLVRKEKEYSSKVTQPTTRTQDFESLFQAVQQLAVFELPHGKTRRVRPSVIPGNDLSPVIQFQNGRRGDAQLSRRLLR